MHDSNRKVARCGVAFLGTACLLAAFGLSAQAGITGIAVHDLATGDPLLNAAPITSTATPGSDQSATTFWGRGVSAARDNLQTFTVGPEGLNAEVLYFQYDRSVPFGGDMQIRFFQTNNPEAAGPSIDDVLWTETVSLAGLGEPEEGVLEVRFDPTVLSPNTSYGFQFLDRDLPFLIREHNNPGDSLGGGRYWEQGWTAATRVSDMAFGIATDFSAPPVLTPAEEGGGIEPGNLAASGAAFAKDVLAGRQIGSLHDGTFGDASAWIGNTPDSFAGVSLGADPVQVRSLAFGRDNTGVQTDRALGEYTLQFTAVPNPDQSTPDGDWTTFGTVLYEAGSPASPHLRHRFNFSRGFSRVLATGIRLRTPDGAAIDELEIYENIYLPPQPSFITGIVAHDLATGDPLLDATALNSTAAPGSEQSATSFWGRSVSDARDNLQTFTVGPEGLNAEVLYFQYDRLDTVASFDDFAGDLQLRIFQTNDPEGGGPPIDTVLWTDTVSLGGLNEPEEGVLEIRFNPTALSPGTSYGFQFLDRDLPFFLREHNNPADVLPGRYWEAGGFGRFSDLAFGIGSAESGFSLTDISHDPLTGALSIRWESKSGKLYNLRSETDPSATEPIVWPIFESNRDIAATPPENSLTFPLPADPFRLFVVEEFPAPPVSIFSDDLESGQGGWTLGSDGVAGTAWELGAPSTVGPASAHSPTNCFGTNLAANYTEDADVWLRSPPIDLTTAGGATLRYAQFFDIEKGFDSGRVAVLDAGDDSELAVLEDPIEGTSTGWEEFSQSLPAAVLGKTVKIEFRFSSDDIEFFSGWYIDDVVVTVP